MKSAIRSCFLILVCVAVLCCGFAAYEIGEIYSTVGRIGDFRATGSQVDIPETSYRLKFVDDLRYRYVLVNRVNGTTTEIGATYTSFNSYRVITHHATTYLILRSGCNCTINWDVFSVINLSVEPPRLLGTETACFSPKLVDDRLEFESYFQQNCERGWPLLSRTVVHKIELQ